MKGIIIIYISMLSALCCAAQSAATVEAYIDLHKSTALKFEKKYGIPAPITLAQAIVESAAGTSRLTQASNNHFCIKAGGSWHGPIHLAWDDEAVQSRFRKYNNADESFEDYARLLSTNSVYRNLFSINVYDYRGWAKGLKKAGYATNPEYAKLLIGTIDHYKLYNINGGVKLRAGKTVIIVKREIDEMPVFDEECIMEDDALSEEEAVIAEVIEMEPVEINDIPCTALKPGETIATISRNYNIDPDKLLKYNDVQTNEHLSEGQIIFLQKKKNKYNGAQDFYIASKDESLYEISQKFGIKLESLAKMNGLRPNIIVNKGTRIYLK